MTSRDGVPAGPPLRDDALTSTPSGQMIALHDALTLTIEHAEVLAKHVAWRAERLTEHFPVEISEESRALSLTADAIGSKLARIREQATVWLDFGLEEFKKGRA